MNENTRHSINELGQDAVGSCKHVIGTWRELNGYNKNQGGSH